MWYQRLNLLTGSMPLIKVGDKTKINKDASLPPQKKIRPCLNFEIMVLNYTGVVAANWVW